MALEWEPFRGPALSSDKSVMPSGGFFIPSANGQHTFPAVGKLFGRFAEIKVVKTAKALNCD